MCTQMVCCTCDLCSMLGTGIYYLCVLDSISLMMLMMIEGPERGLAYAIETLTILGKTMIDLGIRLCINLCQVLAHPGI